MEISLFVAHINGNVVESLIKLSTVAKQKKSTRICDIKLLLL